MNKESKTKMLLKPLIIVIVSVGLLLAGVIAVSKVFVAPSGLSVEELDKTFITYDELTDELEIAGGGMSSGLSTATYWLMSTTETVQVRDTNWNVDIGLASISSKLEIGSNVTFSDTVASISGDFNVGDDLLFADISADTVYGSGSYILDELDVNGNVSISGSFTDGILTIDNGDITGADLLSFAYGSVSQEFQMTSGSATDFHAIIMTADTFTPTVLDYDGIYSSDSLDFDEFSDTPTLDNDLVISGDYYIQANRVSVSEALSVDGTASISAGLTVVGSVTLDDDVIAEGDISFSTACNSSSKYYLNGNDLACNADADTTYTVNGDPLSLVGTTFDIDYASGSAGGYILGTDFQNFFDHVASNNQHLDWTTSVGTIHTDNYIEGIVYTATNPLSLVGTAFSIDLASTSGGGYLSNTDWDTFNNKQAALTFELPLVNVSNTVSASFASAGDDGWLSSTDWTTFNNKWDALTDMVLTDAYIYVGDASNDPVGVAMSNDVTLSNTGVATIGSDKILEGMLKAVNAATDEYILTYEATTGDFEWHSPSELITDGTNITWNGTTLNVDDPFSVTTLTGTHVSASDDLTIEDTLVVASDSFRFGIASAHYDMADIIPRVEIPENATIDRISCFVTGGTSREMEMLECDSNDANCTDVDSAIVCATTKTDDDGSLTNATIDAGDILRASVSEGDEVGTTNAIWGVVHYYYTAP